MRRRCTSKAGTGTYSRKDFTTRHYSYSNAVTPRVLAVQEFDAHQPHLFLPLMRIRSQMTSHHISHPIISSCKQRHSSPMQLYLEARFIEARITSSMPVQYLGGIADRCSEHNKGVIEVRSKRKKNIVKTENRSNPPFQALSLPRCQIP